MRKPRKGGPRYRNKAKSLDTRAVDADLNAAADGAKYMASNYHCPDTNGRFARRGFPTMTCPEGWTDRTALRAVQNAIRAGHVSSCWVGKFPRHVWHNAGDRWYEGRTHQSEPGVYHGYPIEEDGLPAGLR